ncbi:hypothetical protein FACS189467_1720 [Bacteroidia bacterium]|nr:hypothetical protein FACS189467_1720 [Bacteroidia bacterium]
MITTDINQLRIVANKREYERLRADANYTNVKFDDKIGGLLAIHKDHQFDKKKGWYEEVVQNIGYKNGYSVILGSETGKEDGARYTEGWWNNLPFEIASTETGTKNNIKKGLKHCASKRETEIAVLFFPNDNFDIRVFNDALAMYNGLKKLNNGQYKQFHKIICISGGNIIYKKTHP